eukprot:COSAG02_NODE_1447_length_12575_cov_8.479400_9_plen_143_part_00
MLRRNVQLAVREASQADECRIRPTRRIVRRHQVAVPFHPVERLLAMAVGEQLLDGPVDTGLRTIHAKRRPRPHDAEHESKIEAGVETRVPTCKGSSFVGGTRSSATRAVSVPAWPSSARKGEGGVATAGNGTLSSVAPQGPR